MSPQRARNGEGRLGDSSTLTSFVRHTGVCTGARKRLKLARECERVRLSKQREKVGFVFRRSRSRRRCSSRRLSSFGCLPVPSCDTKLHTSCTSNERADPLHGGNHLLGSGSKCGSASHQHTRIHTQRSSNWHSKRRQHHGNK